MFREMAVRVEVSFSGPLVCVGCKSPYADAGRALCPSCLTQSLQRACKNSTVSLPGTPSIGRVSPRAFFPGMPRAVLSHSEGALSRNLKKRSSKNGSQQSAATTGEKITILIDDQVATCKLFSKAASPATANVSRSSEASRVNEDLDHGHVSGTLCPSTRNEDDNGKLQILIDAALPRREEGKPVLEKWQLFQLQRHLTVRIPNPATDMPNLQLPQVQKNLTNLQLPQEQKHLTVKVPMSASNWPNLPRPQPGPLPQANGNHQNAQPLQKRALAKTSRQIKPRKWRITPDADAEADLMMRLLADTMPLLKSSAPLVLPPCKIMPPPGLSPSPPSDPLWKRRCIPCPKTLELRASSICVN